MKTYLIVAAVMILDAIVFGVLAFVMYRKTCLKLAVFQRTWGVVVVVNERASHGLDGQTGVIQHPVIRFTAADGQLVAFESAFGRSNWGIKPGDRIEVLYNPKQPSEAEPVNFLAQWLLPIIFGVISAGSIIGAPLVYAFLKT